MRTSKSTVPIWLLGIHKPARLKVVDPELWIDFDARANRGKANVIPSCT